MNKHGRTVLEYQAVLDSCRKFSVIDAPLAGIAELPFFYNAEELGAELRLVRICKQCIEHAYHGIGGVAPVDGVLRLLEKEGAIPEIEDFEQLSILVRAYADSLRWFREESQYIDEEDADVLNTFIANWDSPEKIIGILQPYFNPTFKEEEIPEIKAVIGRIQKLHAQIQMIARGFLNKDKHIWSSNELSQRDGRVVLALKSDHRGKVDGLFHGVSGSGQSLYIEPRELFEKNNALNEARGDYHLEIHRILRKCSTALRPFLAELGACQKRLFRFNSLQARALYSRDIDGNSAHISSSDIKLIQARHPALATKAVPINISITAPTRIIVLSGPNTGGKTVAMKTVGLLSLMHQSGMEIPASSESMLPIFSDVLLDIGDEQSIDEGLSTFSAHLRNLGEVLDSAVDRVLILLDELGSGTNPIEGSALAMAVMETIAERNIHAIVTTHHDSLKAYAFKHSAMENASVTFNDNSPNYSIASGIPGESHALDIAQKVGMNAEVLARARLLMEDKGLRIHQLIEDLRKLKFSLAEQEEEYRGMFRDIAQRQEHVERQENDVRRRELALKEQRLLEHDTFMAESRKKIEALLHDLNREKSAARATTTRAANDHAASDHAIHDRADSDQAANDHAASDHVEINRRVRTTLSTLSEEQLNALNETRRAQEALQLPVEEHIAVGMTVRCRGMSRPAEIIERGRKPGTWRVLAGSVKMTVVEKDIEAVVGSPGKGQGSAGGAGRAGDGAGGAEKTRTFSVEYSDRQGSAPGITVDIRGMRAEEALKELDRFLDQACLAGLQFFSVIHGKGTGVLQELAQRFLNDQSQVESVCFAPPEDGGFGKSYVYLVKNHHE